MPFESFDIYTAGYCLMRGQMPRCVPAPGNRYKFVFTDSARAVAAEFDATELPRLPMPAASSGLCSLLLYTTRHPTRHRSPALNSSPPRGAMESERPKTSRRSGFQVRPGFPSPHVIIGRHRCLSHRCEARSPG